MKSNRKARLATLPCVAAIFATGFAHAHANPDLDTAIAELNQWLVPPAHASLADVDAVYRTPDERAPRSGAAADKADESNYELLQPDASGQFRAFLHVVVREGWVSNAAINHSCVLKGRIAADPSTPQGIAAAKEIETENRRVLVNLREICSRFREKLPAASWNRGKIRVIPALADRGFIPQTNTRYSLAGPSLYQVPGGQHAGPAEQFTGMAWSLANEFVFRSALADVFTLPATTAGPAKPGWHRVEFVGKDHQSRLRVEVDLARRLVRLPAKADDHPTPEPAAGANPEPTPGPAAHAKPVLWSGSREKPDEWRAPKGICLDLNPSPIPGTGEIRVAICHEGRKFPLFEGRIKLLFHHASGSSLITPFVAEIVVDGGTSVVPGCIYSGEGDPAQLKLYQLDNAFGRKLRNFFPIDLGDTLSLRSLGGEATTWPKALDAAPTRARAWD